MPTSTKITYIDTNIFLRFLIFDDKNPAQSKKAKDIFSKLSKEKMKVSTNVLVIAEVIYVLEGFYKFPRVQIAQSLKKILHMEAILLDGKEKVLAALELYKEKNVDFEDAYIYFDMLEKEIDDIYTFDITHFKKFENISVV